MCSPGIDGEGELRSNRLTQVHLEKCPLKWSVCVSLTIGYFVGRLLTLPSALCCKSSEPCPESDVYICAENERYANERVTVVIN